jgi:hypothetical protein
MDNQDQRKDGVKLAAQLNANKTLELIKDPNQGIEAILKSAVAEVGLEKLVSIILDSDYSYWAVGALRYIPNLGEHEARLRQKAHVVLLPTDSQAKPAHGGSPASAAATNLPTIGTFRLYLACGVGYAANFTMWYFTPPFANVWTESPINSGGNQPVCTAAMQPCGYFSNPGTPLKTGDTVMMVLNILYGPTYQTGVFLTYDPASEIIANIDAHGQTYNPGVTWYLGVA